MSTLLSNSPSCARLHARGRAAIVIAAAALVIVAGCPQPQSVRARTVNAVIAISSTVGDPPFRVAVSGVDSTSVNGGPYSYEWDFGDGTKSADAETTHTFSAPGRYEVRLLVTDGRGATGATAVDVRVRGGAAVAVIAADVSEGPAPLTVTFDATSSVIEGDTIRDYLWDFDDGNTSTAAAPQHTFAFSGEYTVKLDITTAGGVSASTTTVIKAGSRQQTSLRFDGGAFAVLPLGQRRVFDGGLTLEGWIRPDSEGGTCFILGGGLSVEAAPASNQLRVRSVGATESFAVSGLANTWRHVAVVCQATPAGDDPNSASDPNSNTDPNAGGGGAASSSACTLYLDGQPLGEFSLRVTVQSDVLTIGNGLRGNLSEVRLWSRVRSAAEVARDANKRLNATPTGLVGVWPLNEGRGQVLNNVLSSVDGYLGSSALPNEGSDPDWSNDGPPIQ